MVAISYEMGFPFMAGSGLSVSWRMPSNDLPYGATVEESLVIGSVLVLSRFVDFCLLNLPCADKDDTS